MKKHLILIITLLICATLSAQTKAKKNGHPPLAMDNTTVDMILTAMKNKATDEAKLNVVMDGVKNNTDGIMVDQELRLLNQFSNDDFKLQCAKFLYPWCVDYKNYAKVQYNMSTPAGQKAIVNFVARQPK
jgi:hypothetical protein